VHFIILTPFKDLIPGVFLEELLNSDAIFKCFRNLYNPIIEWYNRIEVISMGIWASRTCKRSSDACLMSAGMRNMLFAVIRAF